MDAIIGAQPHNGERFPWAAARERMVELKALCQAGELTLGVSIRSAYCLQLVLELTLAPFPPPSLLPSQAAAAILRREFNNDRASTAAVCRRFKR